MSDFISALTSFCTFCLTQLSSFANFFTSTVLGQFILGIILITIISDVVANLIKR